MFCILAAKLLYWSKLQLVWIFQNLNTFLYNSWNDICVKVKTWTQKMKMMSIRLCYKVCPKCSQSESWKKFLFGCTVTFWPRVVITLLYDNSVLTLNLTLILISPTYLWGFIVGSCTVLKICLQTDFKSCQCLTWWHTCKTLKVW